MSACRIKGKLCCLAHMSRAAGPRGVLAVLQDVKPIVFDTMLARSCMRCHGCLTVSFGIVLTTWL